MPNQYSTFTGTVRIDVPGYLEVVDGVVTGLRLSDDVKYRYELNNLGDKPAVADELAKWLDTQPWPKEEWI